ncbi:fungal specific transcription factor domain-containing protein [Colletotrichum orchidophilum]|uniref:Fungal specific transcription factor domain-containing protein n=1 Tax=Colletotrichum orchidophilum TaxID=1209926 RepID=A0A1G4BLD6_9PEZI|nr:fungal specific transcription factor domain-containing protein [Colletotrichum orchidophilum]OHF02145.1 fungal specific transcription factor domain-containing protein [Colletotrichum orchidophilum]
MAGVAEAASTGESNADEASKKRIYSEERPRAEVSALVRMLNGWKPIDLLLRNKVEAESEGKTHNFEAPSLQMRRLNVAESDSLGGQPTLEDLRGQSKGFVETEPSHPALPSERRIKVPKSLAQRIQNRVAEEQRNPADPRPGRSERASPFDLPFLPKDLFGGFSVLEGLQRARNQAVAHLDPKPFGRSTFARFPPQDYIIDLETTIMEEVQLFCPAIARETFMELTEKQYGVTANANDCDASARRAIANALFGAALRWRAANDSFDHFGGLSWAFYKNAYAIFPELILQGTNVLACEAMLAMATFSLGTADARTTAQLASAAARTAQIIGLHRRETYANLDATESARRKRVFWAAHTLNTDMMAKYGLSHPLAHGDVTVELPAEDATIFDGTSQAPSFLRSMAQLSRIQVKLHEKFSPHNLQLQSGTDHHMMLILSTCELEEWKSTLPPESRPDPATLSATRELDMPIALLHFIYFSTLIKTNINLARLKNATSIQPSSPLYNEWVNRDAFPIIEQSYANCTSAARAIIDLVHVMPPQPYVNLWFLLGYPVMASLILLWSSLDEPTGSEAHLNVRIMGQFVRFLAGVKEEGCELRNVLEGCSKIHKIAKYVVHTQRAIRSSAPLAEDNDVKEQLENLRVKLSEVTDWMYLAQGLLSNMPLLCAQARDIFADVLGMDQVDADYGVFAPELLKPHKHNVFFSS